MAGKGTRIIKSTWDGAKGTLLRTLTVPTVQLAEAGKFAYGNELLPTTDHTATGTIVTLTAGENLVFGDACYFKSDGKMWKVNADVIATSTGLLAVALATIAAEAAGSFLMEGYIRDDTWAWTVGGGIYLSTTAGGLTQTAPTGADDVVRLAGIAISADVMLFFGTAATYEHDGVLGIIKIEGKELVPGAHGAAKHTNVTRTLFISATGYTDGALATYGNHSGQKLVDAALKQSNIEFRMPSDFVSFTSLKLVWASGAASGNMYWSLDAYYASATEGHATHSESSGLGTTATGGADKINVQTSATALTLASVTGADYVGIKVTRDGVNASDTLTADVVILGLLLEYTAEQ